MQTERSSVSVTNTQLQRMSHIQTHIHIVMILTMSSLPVFWERLEMATVVRTVEARHR